MIINIKLQSDDEKLIPEQKHVDDAGFDLKAAHDEVIESGEVKLIQCGFSMEIPTGFEGQVRSRSGLALKSSVFVLNSPGTVDSNFRGIVGVILANISKKPFVVKKYDRIAQLVINAIPAIKLDVIKELSASDRGTGGFGSTGV